MSWKKILLLLVVIAVVVFGLRWYQQHTSEASKPKKAMAVSVKVAAATQGDFDLSLKQVGNVQTLSTVTISAQVDGQLATLAFRPGDRVHKGQLIATLDPRIYQAQLDQARGNLSRDQANLIKARSDLARYTPLQSKGYVAQIDMDTYRNNLAVAQAAIASDRAAVELAQTQLGYTRIYAPFDGQLGAPLVYPGAVISANTTGIVVLNQMDPIWISFALPQDSLPAVKLAQARGPVQVLAHVDGDQGKSIPGTLDFINNTIDTSTSTITLKAHFDNADGRLMPGQFVNVSLPTQRITKGVTIPVVALQSNANGNFVFVLKADHTVEQRPVTAGPSSAERVVIDKGLAAGEQVVTDGVMQLVDGSHVQVVAP